MKHSFEVECDNLTDVELDQLYTLIEKAKAKPHIWKPANGETYYFVGHNGNLIKARFNEKDYFGNDEYRYMIGNCFKNDEEAKEYAEALRYRTMLKRLSIESGEEDNLWNGNNEHWIIKYNIFHKNLWYCVNRSDIDSNIHFASEESAHDALATIGEENYKRYILGIKEE